MQEERLPSEEFYASGNPSEMPDSDATRPEQPAYSYEEPARRDWVRWLIAGLGLAATVTAVVLLVRNYRRRNTPASRAERALIDAATSLERAAQIVGEHGPSLFEQGALKTEELARTVRKRGPAYVRAGGTKVERLGKTIRTQGPDVLVRGAERVEEAARTFRKSVPGAITDRAAQAEEAARTMRKQGPALVRSGAERANEALEYGRGVGAQVAGYTNLAVDRTREIGDTLSSSTQDVANRVQRTIRRQRDKLAA